MLLQFWSWLCTFQEIYPVLQFFLGTLFEFVEFDLREKARGKQTWSSPKHPVHRRTGLGQNLKPAIRVMEFLNKKDNQREARSPNWFECTPLGLCWGKGKDGILGGGGSVVERGVCSFRRPGYLDLPMLTHVHWLSLGLNAGNESCHHPTSAAM